MNVIAYTIVRRFGSAIRTFFAIDSFNLSFWIEPSRLIICRAVQTSFFSLALIRLEAWPGYEGLSRLTLTRRTLKCGRARPRDWNTNRKGPIYEQACRWINGTNKGRKVSQRVFAIQPKLCSLFQEHPFTSRDEGLTLVTSASWSCSSGNLALINRPFPNYLWPLLQGESWCSSFHMKISFHLHVNQN